MSYKEKIYKNYVSNHNKHLYGEETLKSLKNNFKTWKYYFGKLLPFDKQAVILDIGCGNGGFVYFLQQLGYNNISGIDISEEQILAGQNLGISGLEKQDLFDFLKTNTKRYDFIIARDVIEHFEREDVFNILTGIYNCLNNKGSLVIQVPNGQGLFYTSIFYGDFTHEWAYTQTSLNQIFRNIGFNDINCKGTGPVPKGFISILRFIIWHIMLAFVKFAKMVATGSPSGIFTQNIICKASK